MKITWYGTATIGLDDGETKLLFDPFVRMNRRIETTPVEGFAGFDAVFVTHGHIFNRDHLPPLKEGDVLLYGHTHVPLCETVSGIVCMNPGSVSIPKENSPRGYMTLEGGVFRWKTLAGEEYQTFDANA